MLSTAEQRRYHRHLLLDEIGPAGQIKLKRARVCCVGAGGLGSPVLLYLAAAGVGQIGIVDDDVVEESNLQRQVVHSSPAVGRSKCDSAAERLMALNPGVRIVRHKERLRSGNALRILADYDIVIDGCDNFPARYLINDACVLLDKPFVYGSIYKFEGQVSVFNHDGGPTYRDLFPEPPPPGSVPSCGEAGVLGVLPGVIGTIQATEALKILLGIGSALRGRLLLYNALEMRFHELELERDTTAPAITQLTDYAEFCGLNQPKESSMIDSITPQQLQQRMDEGWQPFVLDVRRPEEAAVSKLPFANLLQPHDQILAVVDQLPAEQDIVVHCKGGHRSMLACQALAQAGFTRLFNLEGGMMGWERTFGSR